MPVAAACRPTDVVTPRWAPEFPGFCTAPWATAGRYVCFSSLFCRPARGGADTVGTLDFRTDALGHSWIADVLCPFTLFGLTLNPSIVHMCFLLFFFLAPGRLRLPLHGWVES